VRCSGDFPSIVDFLELKGGGREVKELAIFGAVVLVLGSHRDVRNALEIIP